MIALLKKILWRSVDPLLARIGSRMNHLGLLTPAANRRYFDTIACIEPTAEVARGALLYSQAPRENFYVGAYSYLSGHFLLRTSFAQLRIGHHCVIGANTQIWAHKSIKIGDYVQISHSVDIHDCDTHAFESDKRRADAIAFCEHRKSVDVNDLDMKPVEIESDAWIGFKASILKGVTIGQGAIVAAGSVVTKDVPPFTMVAGNPARVIRRLSKADT